MSGQDFRDEWWRFLWRTVEICIMTDQDFHNECSKFSWRTVKIKELLNNFSNEVTITKHFKIKK